MENDNELIFTMTSNYAGDISYDVIWIDGTKIGKLTHCDGIFLFATENGYWVSPNDMKEILAQIEKIACELQ